MNSTDDASILPTQGQDMSVWIWRNLNEMATIRTRPFCPTEIHYQPIQIHFWQIHLRLHGLQRTTPFWPGWLPPGRTSAGGSISRLERGIPKTWLNNITPLPLATLKWGWLQLLNDTEQCQQRAGYQCVYQFGAPLNRFSLFVCLFV